EELRLAHAGADWSCPYCGSGNRAVSGRCASCGARVGADGSSPRKRARSRRPRREPSANLDLSGLAGTAASLDPPKRRGRLLAGIAVAGALFGGGLIVASGGPPKPVSLEAEVSRLNWTHTTQLEAWREVQRGDWGQVHARPGKAPVKGAGAYAAIKDVSCQERQRGDERYRCGLESYTTSESYRCGSTQKCSTRNNANGSFTRSCRTVPQTCQRSVQRTRPKHCTRPVYETWCDYLTEEWTTVNTKENAGEGHGGYSFPTFDALADDQRTSQRATYTITFSYGEGSRYREEVQPAVYESWSLGERAILTRVGSRIVGYRRPRADE
ncbi:MAG: hypothetical protein KC486_32040, partial [Myxococcales bacterium]|nr:hypothetical protein [Myxococcales bacterium]